MTSPVPSTGSGTVSIASGEPKAFRTAAFMDSISRWDGAASCAGFPAPGRPGIILGSDRPSAGGTAPWPIQAAVEFGDFLRSRREKLTPKTVGLPGGRRRRTPGLRREEVAELAGIGVDWYIRLEQGRTVSPSATTVDALARALRLTKTEHAHLQGAGARRRAGARSRARPCRTRPADGREAEPAGLCHRPALGRAGLERGRRGDLRLRPVAGAGRNIADPAC